MNSVTRAAVLPDAKPARQINYLNSIGIVVLYASACLCFWQVNLRAVLLAIPCYFIMQFGMNVGFHRLLTHRSFKTYRWVERVLAVIGTLNMQRGVVWWVATHRMHHAETDRPGDPHSAADGFFYSYMGWLLWEKKHCNDPERLRRYSRDIANDPFMVMISRTDVTLALFGGFFMLVYLTFDLPAALWCVCGRAVLEHQTTFMVNSICHRWGYRTYDTPDRSTNNRLLGFLVAGAGWHNNHHYDPDAAAHGRFPGEFDLSYQVIRGLERLGLAWDVKEPRSAGQAAAGWEEKAG